MAHASARGGRGRLLCEACEQRFGRIEGRIERNWKAMRQGREILPKGNNAQWRPATERTDKRQKERRLDPARTPRPERWTKVDEGAWRKLAAINAWRMAASAMQGLDEQEAKLSGSGPSTRMLQGILGSAK